jgi:hypothetical protein
MSANTTEADGRPYEPTAEDLDLIERARRRFAQLGSLPPVGPHLQKRVQSEMGVEEDPDSAPRDSENQ